MHPKEIRKEVGVIIGRFQSPTLHAGHIELINWVCSRHQKVIIFIGMSTLRGTINNPLDFESRKQMILAKFPEVNVLYIKDVRCDSAWSKTLDSSIGDLITPNQRVTLYGSRDSFIPYYNGRFETVELEGSKQLSATEIRNKTSEKCLNSDDFRSGVTWAAYNKYPTVYSTVDVAIFNEDQSKILLGRKKNEKKFRFIGGFSDVSSSSFEEDARREVFEETNLSITDPVYLGSCRIDDWRYRKEKDKINTTLFYAKKFSGQEKASDDIEEIKWFNYNELTENDLMEEHGILLNKLKSKI